MFLMTIVLGLYQSTGGLNRWGRMNVQALITDLLVDLSSLLVEQALSAIHSVGCEPPSRLAAHSAPAPRVRGWGDAICWQTARLSWVSPAEGCGVTATERRICHSRRSCQAGTGCVPLVPRYILGCKDFALKFNVYYSFKVFSNWQVWLTYLSYIL